MILLDHRTELIFSNNSSPQCLFATPLRRFCSFNNQKKYKKKIISLCNGHLRPKCKKINCRHIHQTLGQQHNRITCVELLLSAAHELGHKLWTNNPEAFALYRSTAYDIFSPEMFAIVRRATNSQRQRQRATQSEEYTVLSPFYVSHIITLSQVAGGEVVNNTLSL